MVSVKGNSASSIASITQLGLSDGPIRVSLEFRHKEVQVDAWGGEVPVELQFMLAAANISMTLIHFDEAVLETCIQQSMAGGSAFGTLPRAGTRMLGNNARFAPTSYFIGLNILSPVAAKPWRFWYAYLAQNPMQFPLGTEKSIVQLQWRAIPATNDAWGGGSAQPGSTAGTGSQGAVLFDRQLDT